MLVRLSPRRCERYRVSFESTIFDRGTRSTQRARASSFKSDRLDVTYDGGLWLKTGSTPAKSRKSRLSVASVGGSKSKRAKGSVLPASSLSPLIDDEVWVFWYK